VGVQGLPRGEPAERDGRRSNVADGCRFRRQIRSRHDGVLGGGTRPGESNQPEYLIAVPPAASRGPAPTTTPDRSWHGMTGHASGQASSPAVIAVARTCTSTSPGSSRGTGTLSYRRPAGSALEARMACIVSGALFIAIFLIFPGPAKRSSIASAECGTLPGTDDPADQDVKRPAGRRCASKGHHAAWLQAHQPGQPSSAKRSRQKNRPARHRPRPHLPCQPTGHHAK
jgi:hypothetical protein